MNILINTISIIINSYGIYRVYYLIILYNSINANLKFLLYTQLILLLLFHDLYGQSCKEYIEFIRISKVKDLLLFTDFDLSYISQKTGFSDCSHLIRTFKKKTGITPKHFRMQHIK